jgi:hypothetical protein
VTDLYNLHKNLLRKLNDNIIQLYPFTISLHASNNSRITNVSHMRSLKVLNAWGNCGIGDVGITGLDLVELDASDNSGITNVSHMKSLKKLHAYGNCGIGDAGIAGLDLVELDAGYNSRITKKID